MARAARPDALARGRSVHWAFLPAWATYALALFDTPLGRWLDRESLILGMHAEWVAVLTIPTLAGLASIRHGPEAVRWISIAGASLGVSVLLLEIFGFRAVLMYWFGGCLTYLGWAFEAHDEERFQRLVVRWVVTFTALVPTFLFTVAAAKLAGLEPMLLLGACYFLLLQVLEVSGTYALALARYRALQHAK